LLPDRKRFGDKRRGITHGRAHGIGCNLKPSEETPKHVGPAVLRRDRLVAARDSTQADMMVEFVNKLPHLFS
jgi:hypothetical protein